jgi:hypothetical protein
MSLVRWLAEKALAFQVEDLYSDARPGPDRLENVLEGIQAHGGDEHLVDISPLIHDGIGEGHGRHGHAPAHHESSDAEAAAIDRMAKVLSVPDPEIRLRIAGT